MAERIGFTATRTIDPDDALVILDIVQSLPADATLVVGACVGGDATIARAGILTERLVHAIVPSNRSQVDPDWRDWCTSFTLMSEGTDYCDRNTEIVKQSDRMIVVAQYPEDHPQSKRSGTWMTCRIAQRMGGKQIDLYVLRPEG